MKKLALYLFFLGTQISSLSSADSRSTSAKINLGIGNGIVSNQGTAGGSTLLFGSLNLDVFYFFTSRIALGIGYHLDFDYAAKSLTLSGVMMTARYYFYNQGTRTFDSDPLMMSLRRDTFALYVAPSFVQDNYYLGLVRQNGQLKSLSGSSLSVMASAGADFAISDSVDFNAEAGLGIFSFAASDPGYRISSMVAKFGFSYLW